MKCKNCKKLKKDHYEGTGDNRGGDWCNQYQEFPIKDNRYFMRFEEEMTSAIQEKINGVARIIEQLESDYGSFVVKEAFKLRKSSLNLNKTSEKNG